MELDAIRLTTSGPASWKDDQRNPRLNDPAWKALVERAGPFLQQTYASEFVRIKAEELRVYGKSGVFLLSYAETLATRPNLVDVSAMVDYT